MKIFISVVAILSCVQISMLTLYMVDEISAIAFARELSFLNCMTASCALVSLLILAFKYSGSPYKSTGYKKKIQTLTLGVFIWAVCRYIRSIWGIFDGWFYVELFLGLRFEHTNDDVIVPMIILLRYLSSEIFPFLFILDWSFMEMFVHQELADLID